MTVYAAVVGEHWDMPGWIAVPEGHDPLEAAEAAFGRPSQDMRVRKDLVPCDRDDQPLFIIDGGPFEWAPVTLAPMLELRRRVREGDWPADLRDEDVRLAKNIVESRQVNNAAGFLRVHGMHPTYGGGRASG